MFPSPLLHTIAREFLEKHSRTLSAWAMRCQVCKAVEDDCPDLGRRKQKPIQEPRGRMDMKSVLSIALREYGDTRRQCHSCGYGGVFPLQMHMCFVYSPASVSGPACCKIIACLLLCTIAIASQPVPAVGTSANLMVNLSPHQLRLRRGIESDTSCRFSRACPQWAV